MIYCYVMGILYTYRWLNELLLSTVRVVCSLPPSHTAQAVVFLILKKKVFIKLVITLFSW